MGERQFRILAAGLGLLWLAFCLVGLGLPPGSAAAGLAIRLFWGGLIPAVFLVLVVAGHEPWRRSCPLAYAATLGQQLARRSAAGPPQRRRVAEQSWLGRHHVPLQAALLWLGLSARLLLLHHSAAGLAWLCLLVLAAAFGVGWFAPGRVWCHYLCPMGPVEATVVGVRGLLGSRAHVLAKGTPGQSTCRTISRDGRETNGCVHCQSPCLDIDAERSYWLHLQGRSPQHHFGWAYPGLVLAFFWLLLLQAGGSHAQLWHGAWVAPWEEGSPPPGWLLSPLPGLPISTPALPRLLAVPLLLLLGSLLSWGLFAGLHRGGLSLHRSRLLARFSALAILLLAADPTLQLGGDGLSWAVRGGGLGALLLLLRRDWNRTALAHAREALVASLGRQWQRLGASAARGLDAAARQQLWRGLTSDLRHHAVVWPERELAQLQARLPRQRTVGSAPVPAWVVTGSGPREG